MFRIYTNNNPVTQFFFAIFIAIFVFIVFMFLSMPIAYWLYGPIALNFEKFSDVNNPTILPIIKFYQIVQSLGLFVIPPFVIAWFYSKDIKNYLSFGKTIDFRQVFLIVLIVISAMPLINLIANYNSLIRLPQSLAPVEQYMKDMEDSAEKTTLAFLNTSTIGGLLFNILMVAIIPAIGEELMFRGVLQKIFTNWTRNVHWGILISSFLFTVIHFQFYGLFPRWILGMVFGYLLLWSESIWAPILAHFINNSFAVLGYFMVSKGSLGKESLDAGSTTDAYPYTVMSTVLFIAACYYFSRLNRRQ
jgi:uncharacterized protein